MSEVLARSAIADLESLPLRPADEVRRWGPTLVVAPHPDDESLGCGGAIALLRERDIPVHVLVVSDGTGSHPHSRRYPPPALRALREAEATAALGELGVEPEAITFLGLRDTAVPAAGAGGFDAAVDACRATIAGCAPTTILLAWRRDPHCDHRAAWEIVTAAVAALPRATRPRLLEYVIWVWDLGAAGDAPTVDEVRAWRLDIGPALAKKRAAITAHRSQTTGLIDDDPDGFRLPPETLARFTRPWELYLEPRETSGPDALLRPAPTTSLPAEYFEELHRTEADPWGFESSAYEAAKYAATLAALPRARYRAALEIGCSIGVLTARLAERCDALLAIDVAEAALRRARARCQELQGVRFARLQVPEEFPGGQFDLILVSEVGYYWSQADLARVQRHIVAGLTPGGHLLLVHYTPFVAVYPLTGDQVHQAFLDRAGAGRPLRHLDGRREARYRLDLFERV